MSEFWNFCNRLTLGIMILVILAPASSAVIWTVTNTNDSGAGSLRNAISSAASGDTVNFSLTYPAAITLTSGTLSIGQNLTISGPVSSNLTINGNKGPAVVSIGVANVNISGVTITGGGVDSDIGGSGGGIVNSGTLTLTNSTVSGNTAISIRTGNGGGIYNTGTLTIINCSVSGNSASSLDFSSGGGGIYNTGTLTITDSTLSGNSAGGDVVGSGGAIYNLGTLIVRNSILTGNTGSAEGGGEGGGIYNASGTLTLTNSTLSGNSAYAGGELGGGGGGGVYNAATATITNSTLSDNSCSYEGGGIYNSGTLALTNSTLFGNTCVSSGGAVGGGIYNGGTLTLTNDTFSGNSAPAVANGQSGTLTAKGTILADMGDCSISAGSYAASDGYNISNDATCSAFLNNTGDLIETPAGLDPNGLRNNGGPAQTIALLPGSPAIDAIPVSAGGYCTAADGVTPVTTDQRGVSRPQETGCDIGAFELTYSTALLTIAKYNTTGLALGQLGATYTIIVSNAVTASSTSGTVTVTDPLPSGLTLVSMAGTGWSCASSTCTRGDVLAAGASYPPITVTVNVAVNAISPLINATTVSGGGSATSSASASATVTGDPTLSIANASTGSFALGQQAATYSLTVSNATAAGPTSGTVTVFDTLPSGLTLASMLGAGWSCSNNTCTRSDVLAAGASYPPITVTVNVAANATSPQVNMATVSGGGWATASASNYTTITGTPALSIAKSHTGSFALGQQGAIYTITVSNAGSGPTTGTVSVSDALPSGLTLVTIGGLGWTCAGNTCSRADALALGASYSPITVTVNVAAHASSPQINTATVSGGGSAAYSASDSTTITGAPLLSIASTHTGSFGLGQQGAAYTLTVSNPAGSGPTSGTVTVSDTVPSGLTLVSMAGTGWSCTGNTCTRSDVLAAGASYPSLTVTVNVAANATSPQVNFATVSGGSSASASASDSTTILAPSLSIVKSHTGSFTQGQQGVYSVTVSNAAGAAPTSGTVTVTDIVPAGLTLASMTGTGWSCASGTCTRSDVLAAGASYPAITVTVNVSSTAPLMVTNVATVSGGDSPGSLASDPTNITPPTYVISGSVTVGGVGLSGVTVSLSGTFAGSTLTNGSGSYSFSGLAAGGAYILAASLTGYTFSAPVAFSNLSANETANFTATALIASKVGIFRDGVPAAPAFLLNTEGSDVYQAGVDRYINTFIPPGGALAGDIAIAGDWTGNGQFKIGIFRPGTGQWWLDANNDGVFDAGDLTYGFGGLVTAGVNQDVPVVGDWTGIGKSCIGVFRQGFSWLLDLNCNGTFDNTPTDAFFPFGGLTGDVPVVEASVGTGTRVGIVRAYAPGGVVGACNSTTNVGCPFFWVFDAAAANNPGGATVHQPAAGPFPYGGLFGDVFVTGDWLGTGQYQAGVYRQGFWLLDVNGSHTQQTFFGYGGLAGDAPIVGKW